MLVDRKTPIQITVKMKSATSNKNKKNENLTWGAKEKKQNMTNIIFNM